jgi:hypothetical protein
LGLRRDVEWGKGKEAIKGSRAKCPAPKMGTQRQTGVIPEVNCLKRGEKETSERLDDKWIHGEMTKMSQHRILAHVVQTWYSLTEGTL